MRLRGLFKWIRVLFRASNDTSIAQVDRVLSAKEVDRWIVSFWWVWGVQFL